MYGWKSQQDTFLPEESLYEKVCEKCGKTNY